MAWCWVNKASVAVVFGAAAMVFGLGVGCRADAPVKERVLRLEVSTEVDLQEAQADKLILWFKRQSEEGRFALSDPEVIELAPGALEGSSVVLEVVPGQVLSGSLDLFVVLASAERSEDERWRFGLPLALTQRSFDTAEDDTVVLALDAYDPACDRDGDYFQACLGPSCCPGFVGQERFVDCFDAPLDDPELIPLHPEDAHPFQSSELDAERCGNGVDEDCWSGDESCDDADNDGWSAPEDCNDDNPQINPDAQEICGNGRDEDCDGQDTACINDNDGDGYFTPEDCNDDNPQINPGVDGERNCDSQDEDCDGLVDEGLSCNDLDGDGVEDDQDCVNTDRPGQLPGAYDSGRSPMREEICGNDIDENCDGVIAQCPVDDADADDDGFIDARQGGRDCNDSDPFVHPDAAEYCLDDIDNDCRGGVGVCSNDKDGDGFDADVDCDDDDPNTHPARSGAVAVEICDLVDNDCDGIIDEGNPLVLSRDAQTMPVRCGFGDVGLCQLGWNVCSKINGQPGIVCADVIEPAPEVCNGLDENCNGEPDDGVLNACGGCDVLANEPGEPCGPCGQDRYECNGLNRTRCNGSTTNACEGCQPLEFNPGDACGQCNRDQYVCAGTDAVTCSGNTTNACGGCQNLNNAPETPCGPCNEDQYVCQGRNNVVCDGQTVLNACGGCEPSIHEPGDECGQCGELACNGDELVCDEALNLCGGCDELDPPVGEACGVCGLDLYVCNGQEQTVCSGDTTNACGGCEALEGQPGTRCANRCDWRCSDDDINAVVCARRNNPDNICN